MSVVFNKPRPAILSLERFSLSLSLIKLRTRFAVEVERLSSMMMPSFILNASITQIAIARGESSQFFYELAPKGLSGRLKNYPRTSFASVNPRYSRRGVYTTYAERLSRELRSRSHVDSARSSHHDLTANSPLRGVSYLRGDARSTGRASRKKERATRNRGRLPCRAVPRRLTFHGLRLGRDYAPQFFSFLFSFFHRLLFLAQKEKIQGGSEGTATH